MGVCVCVVCLRVCVCVCVCVCVHMNIYISILFIAIVLDLFVNIKPSFPISNYLWITEMFNCLNLSETSQSLCVLKVQSKPYLYRRAYLVT